MNILITGANGQLGMEFRRFFEGSRTHRVVALSRAELDISDPGSAASAFSVNVPSVVINCAAYNLVDKAEDDKEAAFRVNAAGVKNLAALCRKHNALLIHYSTDYVFDGTKKNLYNEEDATGPLNVYGESKLSGERLLAEETEDFLLFRVSWVFGPGIANFFYKMSERAKSREVLEVVDDQISIPTYTEDIVKCTLAAFEKRCRGVYHLTNSGYASRYEVIRYYIEKLGMEKTILPVKSGFFNEKARRPNFSAMSNGKLSKDLGMEISEWKNAVDRFIMHYV